MRVPSNDDACLARAATDQGSLSDPALWATDLGASDIHISTVFNRHAYSPFGEMAIIRHLLVTWFRDFSLVGFIVVC